jgi:hypothetical protein
MPMIEKDLATDLIALRLRESEGEDVVPIGAVIAATQEHLDHAVVWAAERRTLWGRIAQLEAECDDAQHANLRLTAEVTRLKETTP